MLCVRFAKNSISCRREFLSKWKCDSTINRNQNVSCNVLIFSLNKLTWTWDLWCWSNCELFTWSSLSIKSEWDCDFALCRVDRLSRRAASSETNRFKRNDEDWNFLIICDDHQTSRSWIAWSSTTWTSCFSTCMRWTINCTHCVCESFSCFFRLLWRSFWARWNRS
jgi:hypothetical protein